MTEINTTPTLNSADLRKVVTDPLALSRLIHELQMGEKGQHRSIGAGLNPGSGMSRAGGNDGIDISREAVQGWLDDGKLTLRGEPTSALMKQTYGSPSEFLAANELNDPREK